MTSIWLELLPLLPRDVPVRLLDEEPSLLLPRVPLRELATGGALPESFKLADSPVSEVVRPMRNAVPQLTAQAAVKSPAFLFMC